MAKTEPSQAIAKSSLDNINLNVTVVTYKPTQDDILKYAKHQQEQLKKGKSVTLNEYLYEEKYKNEKNIIVRADLSNQEFRRTEKGILDLRGVDFTGCILNNVKFKGCDLKDAVFCDTDLNNVHFSTDSVLKNTDFRGCDMSGCTFGERGGGIGGSIKDVKLSTTKASARRYGNVKGKAALEKDRQALIKKQKALITQKNQKMPAMSLAYLSSFVTENEAYKKWEQEINVLKEQLADLQNRKKPIKKSHIMHHSYKYIASEKADYDPSYVRGSTKAERDKPRKSIEIGKKDIEKYLEYVSQQKAKNLKVKSLNEFTKDKFLKDNPRDGKKLLAKNTKFIATCYARYDKGKFLNTDLSDLDFSYANLSGSVFAGADLHNCKFTNANISNASFEGANLNNTKFKNTTAQDANFFDADMEGAEIDNSDFRRAFMPHSKAQNIKIKNSDISYAEIKNGKWDDATIEKSKLDYANMEGISLANADIRKVSAQHAIFDNAMMDGCKIIESNLTGAYMNGVSAKKAEIKDSIMNDIKAFQINFKNAIINDVKLNGANLAEANISKLKGKRIELQNAIMTKIDAGQAELEEVNLKDVKAQFANFKEAVLKKAKANNIDLTGADLEKLEAQEADLTNACLMGVQARKANFKKAILEGVDLRGADLTKADLTKALMEKAKVDIATKLTAGKITGVTGESIEYNSAGEIINQKKSIEEHKSQTEAIDKAKNPSWYQRGVTGKMVTGLAKLGINTCTGIRKAGKTVSKVMDAKVGSKWGKVAGAALGIAAGITLGAAIVGTAALTGGLSIPVTIGIYAGCAAVLGGGGTIAGHYLGNKIGLGSLAAGGLAASVGIPLPVALFGGVAADAGIKQVTGKNISEHLNSAGAAAGVLAAIATTGGASLPILLAGAGAGSLVDKAVEKMTGQSIADHGDNVLEVVNEKLKDIVAKENLNKKAKKWIKEQNKCYDAREKKFTKIIKGYKKQQSKYKEDIAVAKMKRQYIGSNAKLLPKKQHDKSKKSMSEIKKEIKPIKQKEIKSVEQNTAGKGIKKDINENQKQI